MVGNIHKAAAGAFAVALVFAAPALAEDSTAEEEEPWTLELTAATGVAVLSYEESLGTLESEYLQAGYTFRLSLEGNLAGVAPFLRFETAAFSGGEGFDRPGLQQENDSEVATYYVDLGCGFRIDLNGWLTLVPGLGYTYGVLTFVRSDFELNGAPTLTVDLDGVVLSDVDEDLLGHGVTGRIALELDLEVVDLGFHVDYTYYADMKVVNDIGGTTETDGSMLRTGLSATFWFGSSVGLVFGGEFYYMGLDKSDVELEAGAVTVALVQYPNSETFGGTVSVGIRARF